MLISFVSRRNVVFYGTVRVSVVSRTAPTLRVWNQETTNRTFSRSGRLYS